MPTKECLICKNTFFKKPNVSVYTWIKNTKYCSKKCLGLSKKGKPSPVKGRHHTQEAKEKLSKALSGRKQRPETIEKRVAKLRGKKRKPFSEEARKKMSLAFKGRTAWNKNKHTFHSGSFKKGEKHWNWDGGKSDESKTIRKTIEYRLWREAVFKRDHWTCMICGKRGSSELHPDHIKPFSLFPELRFDVSNGRTLCVKCHRQTDTYGSKIRSYKSAKLLGITK